MDIESFIENFGGQFDDADISSFTADTRFREIPEWSSLTALSIIAMIDEEYGVALKGDDVRSANTIKDLFDVVQSRRA